MFKVKTLWLAGVMLALAACTPAGQTSSGSGAGTNSDTDPDNYSEYEDGDLPLLGEPEVATRITEVASGFAFITDMQFAPDGRLFVAEKGGGVRVVNRNGELQEEPVIQIDVNGEGERGLLGIAIDPDFQRNRYIWVYYIADDPDIGETRHRVGRFEERRGKGSNFEMAWDIRDVFLDSTILYGGGLRFGPDGMLYVSPGSGNNIIVVNEDDEPHGKIHRFVPEVPLGIPEDNPDPESSIYARGFRNTFRITFHPETGVLYGAENGPDCDDEINRILPGGHYGWRVDGLCEDLNPPPEYGIDTNSQFVKPVLHFTPTSSPTGLMFYDGDVFPEWQGNLIWCAYNYGDIYYARMREDGYTVYGAARIGTEGHNCTTTIIMGPDGYIYFADIATVLRVERAGE